MTNIDSYPIEKRNKVRAAPKAVYDTKSVYAVLDEGIIAQVAFVDDGHPFVIPMAYGRIENRLYLHGAKATRFFKKMKSAPVSIGVTLVDALVVGRSAFHSSMNYRSVVAFGKAMEVSNYEDQIAGLTAVTDHLMPGRWEEARPMLEKEIRATTILVVDIETASFKGRAGQPSDDPDDYGTPYWGGLIPISTSIGIPVDDGRLVEGVKLPKSVQYRSALGR